MKRVVVIALLVCSALGASSMRASAAGVPTPLHPPHAAQANDYYVSAQSCTGESSGVCAYESVWNDSTAQVGPPTGGYYGCETYGYVQNEYQYAYAELDFGNEGPGTVVGTAGLLTPHTMYSDLAGSGVMDFWSGSGPETGTAIGAVTFNPYNDVITGGKINITVRGTIFTETYSYSTYTWSYSSHPGSMSCTISPGPDAYYGED
jgi:hypothetical protein